jgi:hypothetical protein
MINIKMMGLVVMVALIGFGTATLAIPMISEVSAQGNQTGNQTGNSSAATGSISSLGEESPVPPE